MQQICFFQLYVSSWLNILSGVNFISLDETVNLSTGFKHRGMWGAANEAVFNKIL
jgi:hypothetical protein